MALQMDYEMDNGIIIQGAYFKIIDMFFSPVEKKAALRLGIYANVESRNANKPTVKVLVHEAINNEVIKKNASWHLFGDMFNEISIYNSEKDLTTVIPIPEGTEDIVTYLNNDSAFSLEFEAVQNESNFHITCKNDSYVGSDGNVIDIAGFVRDDGQDAKISDFDSFFSFNEMNATEVNIVKQGYEFLKQLPEYANIINA
jgi:hypothetical protein